MKRVTQIAAVLLSIVMLVACVPTPEQEIVVNKGDGKAQEAIFASPDPDVPEQKTLQIEPVPAHWTDDASTETVLLPIDAEVRCCAGPYPVDAVEKRAIGIDDVDRILKAMYPTAPMVGYALFDNIRPRFSKELRSRALETAEEGALHQQPDGTMVRTPWAMQQNAINQAKQEWSEAPLREDLYIPASELPHDLAVKYGLTVLLEDDREIQIYFQSSQGELYIAEGEHYAAPERFKLEELQTKENAPAALYTPHPRINAQQAIATAEAFLGEIGLSSLKLASSEQGAINSHIERGYVQDGYYLEYVRAESYEAQSFYEESLIFIMSFDDDLSYSLPPQLPETLYLFVTENGVESFEWENPMTVTERINENAALLPFSEICKQVKMYLKLGCANVHDPFGFVGSSMTLSAIPQPLKDGGVVLMPVWILQMDFYP
ncbi:MAG: hypothetical protein IKZ44_07180, partial [Clostridia bacterium]|nr:hypothetical protein [Clostridia bacterium]